jgi:hypothetical protein
MLILCRVTLSKATEAPIVYGPTAKTEFDSIITTDNQEFQIGKTKIKALHTLVTPWKHHLSTIR